MERSYRYGLYLRPFAVTGGFAPFQCVTGRCLLCLGLETCSLVVFSSCTPVSSITLVSPLFLPTLLYTLLLFSLQLLLVWFNLSEWFDYCCCYYNCKNMAALATTVLGTK